MDFFSVDSDYKIRFQNSVVLTRNHVTSHLNIDVSKLTNRDIKRITKQRLNGNPVAEIARYFQVTNVFHPG